MSIRSAAKAVIIKDDKILLNKCYDSTLGEYYDLPGGGQNQYETIEEAIKRECLEETGYYVCVGQFLAICEEIYTNTELRERYPEHTHKIYHIFQCKLSSEIKLDVTEIDKGQISSEWIKIEDICKINIFPKAIRATLKSIIEECVPRFLGTDFI